MSFYLEVLQCFLVRHTGSFITTEIFWTESSFRFYAFVLLPLSDSVSLFVFLLHTHTRTCTNTENNMNRENHRYNIFLFFRLKKRLTIVYEGIWTEYPIRNNCVAINSIIDRQSESKARMSYSNSDDPDPKVRFLILWRAKLTAFEYILITINLSTSLRFR